MGRGIELKEATIKARLTLNGAQFHAGLKSAKNAAHSFASSIGGGLKSAITSPIAAIGGLIAGALSAGAFVAGIKGALDFGSHMEDLKAQTGESADKLMFFQRVLKENGVDAEEAGSIINKMQNVIAGASGGIDKSAGALDALGLSFRDLKGLSPVEQFQKIGEAITKVNSATLRAKYTKDIFGKTGGHLLGALGDKEGFARATQQLAKQAALMKANSAIFDRISDRLGNIGDKARGFFIGVASALAPTLDALTAIFDDTDFTDIGEKFGAAITDAMQIVVGVFQDPETLVAGIGDLLLAYAADFANAIINGFVHAGERFMALIVRIEGILQSAGDMLIGKAMTALGNDVGGNAQQNLAVAEDQKSRALFEKKLKDIGAETSTDFAGAAGMHAHADEAFEKLKQAGQKWLDAGKKQEEVTKAIAGTYYGSLQVNGNADASNFYKLLSPEGNKDLHASDLSNSRRLTPLLTAKERRQFEDEAVAAGGDRHAASAGAYGSVRRGDTARRKKFEHDQLVKESKLDVTNALMKKNVDAVEQMNKRMGRWDAGQN